MPRCKAQREIFGKISRTGSVRATDVEQRLIVVLLPRRRKAIRFRLGQRIASRERGLLVFQERKSAYGWRIAVGAGGFGGGGHEGVFLPAVVEDGAGGDFLVVG